jgi:hypothetical protein
MAKPKISDLYDSSKFDQIEVNVQCWRDKLSGNLFFVPDNSNEVLDSFVQVHDVGGIPMVAKRRSLLERMGGTVFRLAATIFASSRLGLPVPLVAKILKVKEADAAITQKVWSAIKEAREGRPREAAWLAVEALGPKLWNEYSKEWLAPTKLVPLDELEKVIGK